MAAVKPPTVSPGVVVRSLQAMAYEIPVVLTAMNGDTAGPGYIVERISRQDEENGCTVALRLSTGQVVHLGKVARIERASGQNGGRS